LVLRELLSQTQVATAAGLSVPTVKRAEADGGIRVSEDAMTAIASALKKAGVDFIAENGDGPGVRLRRAKR
jgi:transcriptional regulator with XRE-family HTH domain